MSHPKFEVSDIWVKDVPQNLKGNRGLWVPGPDLHSVQGASCTNNREGFVVNWRAHRHLGSLVGYINTRLYRPFVKRLNAALPLVAPPGIDKYQGA